MIVRYDASLPSLRGGKPAAKAGGQFFFDWREGRPKTDEAGHVGIEPRVKQIYRFTGALADIHNYY